ncbi:MAG TPA: methylenetetrahydrofolate--tRNA-(uracil(54)-C(5))-methyltransferase (FADH(2)-oxidizing) TrmFO [Candidatus Rubrimentiphilum sp.]|nr:methylenetetrahydrofolate--tRNA-(uracil(54)-C(5))-methyltransferase (FADH(2)-oxidizing) TrmFO [Candidatus Rubrimentiphilum sp.]
MRLTVIGGGLAGCEAAWQAARCGVDVDLYEMRPHKSGPAHKTANLAELVCSNSLRGAALENAVGLLKEELATLASLIVHSAREAAVPAGGALAVDRDVFARLVEERIASHPRITLRREEVHTIPLDRPTIVACGPLPSTEFLTALDTLLMGRDAALVAALKGDAASLECHGEPFDTLRTGSVEPRPSSARKGASRGPRLHYYDAASPIVAADSIDESQMYRKSRYDKGDGDDYLNIPLDKQQYLELLDDLRTLPRHEIEAFEDTKYFEGCLPIEEMADRGEDTMRFGPLKPVGLRDPRTGFTPYAVVQLRRENREGTAYNLVGFQTRLKWPAQKEAFGKFPGLHNAEWLRLGVMHRNTFIDSPRLLDSHLRLRGTDGLYFAGQITGAEGYVEAAACGAMTGIHAARRILGLPGIEFPANTAFGAVVAHLQNTETHDFQPANVTWAYMMPAREAAVVRSEGKKEKRQRLALSAIETMKRFAADLSRSRTLQEV